MLLAERRDGGEIEGVAQRVGHHHRFGAAGGERRFKLVHARVERLRIIVDEHRHRARLEDRRDGCGKTGRAGDDRIAGQEATFVG